MTENYLSWNPTTVAAAANNDHEWPSSHPACLGIPSHLGDPAQVHLGGQAPMFVHDDVADVGLVRLGGQSPMFQV